MAAGKEAKKYGKNNVRNKGFPLFQMHFLNMGNNLIPHGQEVEALYQSVWYNEYVGPLLEASATQAGCAGVTKQPWGFQVGSKDQAFTSLYLSYLSELQTKTITGTFCVAVKAKTSLSAQVLCFLLASDRARAKKGEEDNNCFGITMIHVDKQKELVS